MNQNNKNHRINVEETIFLCCDQQQSFHKLIYSFETIVGAAKQLLKVANLLGIPVLATEQNPQKLGHLVNDLLKEMPTKNCETFPKLSFSMINDQTKEFLNRYPHRKTAVLFGVEGHVAIQQTALDLLALNYTVFLVTDGISSVRRLDRSASFRRLESEGSLLTTAESVIFELIRTAQHPLFKKILAVLKMDKVSAIAKL